MNEELRKELINKLLEKEYKLIEGVYYHNVYNQTDTLLVTHIMINEEQKTVTISQYEHIDERKMKRVDGILKFKVNYKFEEKEILKILEKTKTIENENKLLMLKRVIESL